MNEKYLNNNPALLEIAKENKTKARKITISELISHMKNLAEIGENKTGYLNLSESLYSFDGSSVNNLCNFLESSGDCIDNTNKLSMFNHVGSLIGFHTLSNGAAYYGFYFSETIYDVPAFAVMYYDSKEAKLKVYVPLYGNAINLETLSGLGAEANSFYFDDVAVKYIEAGLLPKSFNYLRPTIKEFTEFTKVYLNKYGFKSIDELELSWEAIHEDLEAALVQ